MSANTVVPQPPTRTAESAVTPAIKDPNMHEEFLARTRTGNIGLLFLGDSITYRWPFDDPEGWKKFASYQTADFGIGGDRTEHVLWRITNGELDGINPKVTVLLIGTNNIGHFADEKPEWAAAGVKLVVETIHQKLPNTKLLLLAVFPRGTKESPQRKKVAQVSALISGLADEKKTWSLDIGEKFLDEQGEIPLEIMEDGLHLTQKGYGIWYDSMLPTLEKLMKL